MSLTWRWGNLSNSEVSMRRNSDVVGRRWFIYPCSSPDTHGKISMTFVPRIAFLFFSWSRLVTILTLGACFSEFIFYNSVEIIFKVCFQSLSHLATLDHCNLNRLNKITPSSCWKNWGTMNLKEPSQSLMIKKL